MLEPELRETAYPGSCHLPCKKAVRVYLQKDAEDNLGILLLATDETTWGIRIISTMVRKSSKIEVRPRRQGTKYSSWKGNYWELSFTGISGMSPNLKGSSTVRLLLLQFLIVWRQVHALQPRLAPNSWPFCHSLPSVGISGVSPCMLFL